MFKAELTEGRALLCGDFLPSDNYLKGGHTEGRARLFSVMLTNVHAY